MTTKPSVKRLKPRVHPAVTELDAMLPRPSDHPAHRRHRPQHHHWVLSVAVVVVVGAMIAAVVLISQAPGSASYVIPTKSISSEVDQTTSGINQDMSQMNSSDLSSGQLDDSTLSQ